MRKIVCLLSVVMLLSLSACSRQTENSERAFQPPIESISWGMTPEEVVEILALSEESILNINEGVVSLQSEKMDIFGQSAEVVMVFDAQYQMGLLSMEICFAGLAQEALVETLNELYGDYTAVDSEGVPCQWESLQIQDTSETVQERFRYMEVELPAQKREADGFSQETEWNALKEQPLVTVSLSGNSLNINARNMAGYLVYSDDAAYEALRGYLEGIMAQ